MPQQWVSEPLRCWVNLVEEADTLVEVRSELAPVMLERKSASEVVVRIGAVKIWLTSATRIRIQHEVAREPASTG